ncbi:hypothetical protein J6590_060392, partial [Homalodisca vitripennis]
HNRQKASETTGSHCSQERLVTDQCKHYRRSEKTSISSDHSHIHSFLETTGSH